MKKIILALILVSTLALGVGSLYAGTTIKKTGGNATLYATTPDFQANLTNSLDLQQGVGKPTFARTDTADYSATVTDFEGLIKPVKNGEARFEGARRVENLLTYSEQIDNAVWTKQNGASVSPNSAVAPDGTQTADTITIANPATDFVYQQLTTVGTYTLSVWVKVSAGTQQFKLGSYSTTDGTQQTGALTATTNWQRFSVTKTTTTGTGWYVGMMSGLSSGSIIVWGAQLENVSGQSNQNPSEYISKGVKSGAPYFGANVDGVKYFSTYNGNTVSNNVVTEATGSAIPDATLHGYVAEGTRTNLALQSEAFGTVGIWATSTMTVTDNSVVAPSGATTAETLTATNANATILQAITYSATASTTSFYLKRKTGTGNVDITTDGGTNWTTQTITNSWARYTVTTPSATLSIGIRLVTSGDEVYVWGAKLEAGAFASSYIPTVASAVTRGNDILSYPVRGNLAKNYSVYFESNTTKGAESTTIGYLDAAYGTNFDFLLNNFRTPAPNADYLWTPRDLGGVSNKQAFSYLSGTGKSVYFNGTITTKLSGTKLGNDPLLTGSLYIGKANSVWYYFGTIRNVKIWKKVLSDTQLTNLTGSNPTAIQTWTIRK